MQTTTKGSTTTTVTPPPPPTTTTQSSTTGTTTGATGSTTTVAETTTSATGTTSVTGSTTAETTSSTTATPPAPSTSVSTSTTGQSTTSTAPSTSSPVTSTSVVETTSVTAVSTSSSSPSSTTVGTGATVGETTTLTTSSQGSTTTTAPTIPTPPVTTTTPPTTTSYSTTSGQETTTTSSTATTTVTTSTASSLSSTTVGTGATVGETTTLTTSSPGSTTTTRPSIPTPPVSTSPSTETASAGTTSTSAPTTTPCEHKTIEMRENLHNIRVTVVGKSNQYSGTAVTSTLTLVDNSETIIAEIVNVEEDDSPIFTVAFTVSNVGEVNIQLESSTGATVASKPTQYKLGGVNEAVSVDFNGAAGKKLIIQLKKASNELMPMDISKLSIESCFESTACELTTVEQQDVSTFSTVEDNAGNIVEEVFSSSATLDNLPLNENGELIFFVLFNEATLLTMPITVSSVKLQLYYSGFKLYEISSPGIQNVNIHFDLIFENIDSLQFIITPIGDNSVFRINGFVGCVKPIGSTTTSTTTVSTTTQTGSTPTGITTPTVYTGTTTPTITTPCDKTLIASGLNEQNVIVTVPNEEGVYGNIVLQRALPIKSSSTKVVVKLVETVEKDNEIFELTFNTKRIAQVDATLKTEAGAISAGPLTSIPSGANGEVTFNFNGAEGHTIDIILTPSSYDQTIEISELNIEACFDSTACQLAPTVNSDNYQNYVLVTDETATAVDTLFTSGDLSDVQRNSDGNIPVILNFNQATLYDITFSTQEPTTVTIVTGISSYDFVVNGLVTIHLSGLMKDLNTLTFIVQTTAEHSNPVFKIESIIGCMGPMGTTTTASTSTATTGTTTGVETTTQKETTTSGPTFTSPPSESTTAFSVSSTVPSVTSPTTTVSVTPTLSSPTTSITFTQPTTTTATTATTTTMPSTTVGQCIVSGEYLDAMTGYNSYVDDIDKPLGYFLQNGQQVPVYIDDTIEQGEIVHFYCQNCTCSAVGQWECNERIEPCSCSYFTWSDWTNCDKDCGSGIRERTRELIPGLYESCKETDTDKESCFVGPCITTTERPWTTWSPCNADDCETGTQTRTRCESNDLSCMETRTCANNNTNCVCGEGREFKSVCDYTCNSTCKAYRNADCEDRECDTMTCLCADGTTEYNGQCIKFENCPCFDDDGKPMIINTTKVYDDCKICTCTAQGMDCRLKDGCCVREAWSEWNTCHNNNDCGTGQRTRYSAVRIGDCEPEEQTEDCDLEPCGQCVYEGKYYNNTDVVEESSDMCTKKICINGSVTDTTVEGQDGGFSDWTTWGACSATQMQCNGTRERRRECNNPLPHCGEPCVGDFTDTEECSSVICCAVTLWSPWTECSEECGGGITTRSREQLVPGDDAYCSNSLTQTDTCNTQSCESNCTVGEWSDWTPCSVTCGPGSRSRQRDITSDVIEDCPHLDETEDCYPQDCLCTEMNEVWSNYSGCEKTCEDQYSNQPCSGPPACVCEIGFVRNADGVCIKVHECNQCKLPDNTTILEGEDFINPLDKCERCKCEDGKIVCNPKCTEEPECLAGERKVKTDDGCCYTCIKDTCEIRQDTKTLSNITYEGFTECTTNKPVTYSYCSGGCGDSSHFPSGLGLPSQCICCTSIDTERIEIEITCPDPEYPNQSQLRTLTYNQPTSCKCNVSPCMPPK
ncbi:uncharacterized protein [Argopecten irradians]|uniref:uncharacterized protein isoform X3 n=1 Tax=Argopecten irradians TaxID=31199 RepID=UPI0037121C54